MAGRYDQGVSAAFLHCIRVAMLSVLVLIAVGRPAAAQQYRGGMHIGATASTLSGDSSLDFHLQPGWGGGVAIAIDLTRRLSIGPEFLYVVKGAGAETNADVFNRLLGETPRPGAEDVAVDLSWKLTYVDVPLLATYRFDLPSRVHPKFFAGPSVGYRLSARVCVTAEGSTVEFCETDDSVKQLDYGLVLGGGVEVDMGFERMSLTARTMVGGANVREREPALRNYGFAVLLGLVF